MAKVKVDKKRKGLDTYQNLSKYLTDSASKIYIAIAEELGTDNRQHVDSGDVHNFEDKTKDSTARVPKLQELSNSSPNPSE